MPAPLTTTLLVCAGITIAVSATTALVIAGVAFVLELLVAASRAYAD